MATSLLLLDGVCVLCSGFARFVHRRDREGQIRFCWVQSPAGKQILRAAGYPIDSFDTMVFVADGTVFDKSDAFLRVMGQLPFPWRMASLLSVIPRFLRDPAYVILARNRYRWFGRKDRCGLPEGRLMDAFVDGGWTEGEG